MTIELTANGLEGKVSTFTEAVNSGDVYSFLSFFPADGRVVDSGIIFKGTGEIKRWCDREFIGAKAHVTVTKVRTIREGTVIAKAVWKSHFFNGPCTIEFIFGENGDFLRELIIRIL